MAKLIENKENREKVTKRLKELKEKLERNEAVDLSLEAKLYAQENGLTSPTPSFDGISSPLDTRQSPLMQVISYTPDIKVELPKTQKQLKMVKEAKERQQVELQAAKEKLEEIKRNAPEEYGSEDEVASERKCTQSPSKSVKLAVSPAKSAPELIEVTPTSADELKATTPVSIAPLQLKSATNSELTSTSALPFLS